MTEYHSRYWAELLTLREAGGTIENLSRSISNARVDLNPHQVEAALFALRSPLSRGAILADEVGLGKTIEAGIVLAQRWAERRRRILLIVPATLRKQWQQELEEKFYLPSLVLDSRPFQRLRREGQENPFRQDDLIVICSYQFVSGKKDFVRGVPWDLVGIDEAHRLRNVYKTGSKIARNIADAIRPAHKLLLTATPLQNSLMELYGLVSVIDEHVFGDESSFREQFVRSDDEATRNQRLRARLQPICIRTLRKQVIEYTLYTNRIPITQDFTPSDAEHQLYEYVSAFLQRERLISLPVSQRHLLTLVLRKLLASSTFAIARTLHGLVARLRALQSELKTAGSPPVVDDQEYEGLDELQEEWDDAEEADDATGIDPVLLQEELDELTHFTELADRIAENAKGQALLQVLETAFQQAGSRKAVIFTESRRTQEYLFELLSGHGYKDQLVLMNGTNSDALSKKIYRQWLKRHEGQDCVTGSQAVDIKAAIVEEFRDRATLLIATESAAEGVNLQFCSLVINYDLPWNPQRIEQRIGRCHRYGQERDVVVVNFLNRRNEADQRVFELLSEKFQLFNGVFGASDEVLGALESGVDIERRIAEVYQTCRTPEEIAAAFDRLQSELDDQIQTRMEDTRQLLLENFDQDVTERLRVHKDRAQERLSERERWLLALTREALREPGPDGEATFDPQQPRFQYSGPHGPAGWYHLDWKKAEQQGDHFYRQQHPLATRLIEKALQAELPPACIDFRYSGPSAVHSILQPLVGQSGWLEVSRLTVQSLEREDSLLLVGLTDAGVELDREQLGRLLSLPGQVAGPWSGELPDLSALRQAQVNVRLAEVETRNLEHFQAESTKLDLWAEDLKRSLEQEIKELDREIKEAKQQATLAATLPEKLELQKSIKSLESRRKERRQRLFDSQDEIESRRDDLIAQVEAQLKQSLTTTRAFALRWRLT